MAQATRSSDPRLHTPAFQEHRQNSTLRALEKMGLQSNTKAIPQPTVIRNGTSGEVLSERFRHAHPRPPTPPCPSQRRRESHFDGDGNSVNISPTTNNVGWDQDGIDGGVDEADDGTKGGDSPRSTRLYTQEELVILRRKIFGDEEGEGDGTFWDDADDTDGAQWATLDHPEKDERDSMNDAGKQPEESEGKANETAESDGLFGPTSNFCLPTSSKDGLLRSHQHDDDDQTTEVVQDVLETAAGSASIHTSDGVNPLEDDIQPTTTTSMPFTSQEPPRTTLSPSPSTQLPLPLESGFGIRLTKGGTPTGNLQPGGSLEADAEPSEGLSDPLPLPATQLDPSTEEMEPRKPAAVAPSEEEPHCNTIRRIIRKRRLPEFSPTRPGIFSALILNSSDAASLGKRKRTQDDDEYQEEAAFSSTPNPLCDRQVLRPRSVA